MPNNVNLYYFTYKLLNVINFMPIFILKYYADFYSQVYLNAEIEFNINFSWL